MAKKKRGATASVIAVVIAALALFVSGAFGGNNYLDDLFPNETTTASNGTTSASPSVSASSSTASPKSSTAPTKADSGKHTSPQEILLHDVKMNESFARESLEVLPIEKAHSMKGYSDDFFPFWRSANAWGWDDVPDAKGCDARDATLSRDGDNVEVDPETCTPTAGTWTDPYTGDVFDNSSDIDIDHAVPRAAAFRAGADEWDEEQRIIFANSPLELVSSGASSNRAKGDRGPEAWKPEDEAYWCNYAIRWTAIKSEFGLNMTSKAEKTALIDMLDTCETSSN